MTSDSTAIYCATKVGRAVTKTNTAMEMSERDWDECMRDTKEKAQQTCKEQEEKFKSSHFEEDNIEETLDKHTDFFPILQALVKKYLMDWKNMNDLDYEHFQVIYRLIKKKQMKEIAEYLDASGEWYLRESMLDKIEKAENILYQNIMKWRIPRYLAIMSPYDNYDMIMQQPLNNVLNLLNSKRIKEVEPYVMSVHLFRDLMGEFEKKVKAEWKATIRTQNFTDFDLNLQRERSRLLGAATGGPEDMLTPSRVQRIYSPLSVFGPAPQA